MGGKWGDRPRNTKDEYKTAARLARLKAEVYFVEDFEGNIKIGRCTDFYVRFAMLQNGQARPLKALGTIPGGAPEEAAIHARFAYAHIRGEWFRGCHELREYIVAIAKEPEPAISGVQIAMWKGTGT